MLFRKKRCESRVESCSKKFSYFLVKIFEGKLSEIADTYDKSLAKLILKNFIRNFIRNSKYPREIKGDIFKKILIFHTIRKNEFLSLICAFI